MRIFRSLGIMIMIFTAAGIFPGCAPGRLPAGQALPSPSLVATPEDRNVIVAKVNGVGITREALIDIMNRMSAVNERNSVSEAREATRERALDKLIFDELAFQEARRRGLSPGEGALDRAIGTIKANLGNEEAFKSFLAKQGLSEESLRPQVERVLLLQLIVGQEVTQKAGISEETVRKEYERQKDRLVDPGKVTVEDVVFFLKLDDAASMAKANEVLARINADKDKDPANVAADGTFIVQRVELDKEKEPALYDAAGKLKEGELSGVIRTSDSLHIIRLAEYQPERQRSFDEVKGLLKARLISDAQEKRKREWGRELKKGAKIEIMGPEGKKN